MFFTLEQKSLKQDRKETSGTQKTKFPLNSDKQSNPVQEHVETQDHCVPTKTLPREWSWLFAVEPPGSYPWAQWTQHTNGYSRSDQGNAYLSPWCRNSWCPEKSLRTKQVCGNTAPAPFPMLRQLRAHGFSESKITLSSTFSSCKFVHPLFESSKFLTFTTWNELHINSENFTSFYHFSSVLLFCGEEVQFLISKSFQNSGHPSTHPSLGPTSLYAFWSLLPQTTRHSCTMT